MKSLLDRVLLNELDPISIKDFNKIWKWRKKRGLVCTAHNIEEIKHPLDGSCPGGIIMAIKYQRIREKLRKSAIFEKV